MDQGTDRPNSERGTNTERVVDLQQYRDRTVVDPQSWDAARALQDARLAYLPPSDPDVAASIVGGVARRPTRDWTEIVTWEAAAELKLEEITGKWTPEIRSADIEWCHKQIGYQLDWLVINYFEKPIATMDELENAFAYMGVYALSAWRTLTNATLDDLASWTLRTLAQKHADYGVNGMARFGVRGVIVRCADKSERLKNLWKIGHKSVLEPIEDTYLDILGYSTIALMLTDDVFKLPLAKDEGNE
jgi:hypothetical protein